MPRLPFNQTLSMRSRIFEFLQDTQRSGGLCKYDLPLRLPCVSDTSRFIGGVTGVTVFVGIDAGNVALLKDIFLTDIRIERLLKQIDALGGRTMKYSTTLQQLLNDATESAGIVMYNIPGSNITNPRRPDAILFIGIGPDTVKLMADLFNNHPRIQALTKGN